MLVCGFIVLVSWPIVFLSVRTIVAEFGVSSESGFVVSLLKTGVRFLVSLGKFGGQLHISGQMVSLWAESILICLVGEGNVASFWGSVAEFTIDGSIIASGFGLVLAIGAGVTKFVLAVRVLALMQSAGHDGSGADLVVGG
jgi:hypothetical protein